MEKLENVLCQWIVLYMHYFNFQISYLHTFLIFIHFFINVIFTFGSIKGQINIPLWTQMEYKGCKKDGKTFLRCYSIALKFWDKFNADFVLLYFSSYRSIKMWHFYLKNMEKNNKAVYLKLLCTYLLFFNIKKQLALVLKKICPCTFSVFHTNLNKAVNISSKRPEWIRSIQMIRFSTSYKDLDEKC